MTFLLQRRKVLAAEHCYEFKWLFLSAPVLKLGDSISRS